MAEAAEIITTEDALDVLAIDNIDVTPFLVDTDKRRAFLDRVREVASTAGSDVSTAKARSDIIAMAAKVTRCKTAIDNAGKDMTEDWRERTNKVNAARREVRDDLTLVAAEVRRPVTEWEQAEQEREEKVRIALEELRGLIATPAPLGVTSELLRERISEVERDTIDPDLFGDKTEWGEQLRSDALVALRNTLARVEQEEADRAELARLRKAEQERQERENRERAEREAKEREAAKAKAREEEKRRAAEEAERLAQQRADEAAEHARQEERDRIEAEQRKQREAEEKERAAAERKAQNARHRARVLREVAEALESQFDLDGGQSQLIADSIAGGSVPHVSIQF